jgi:hypothetical protein
MILYYIIYVERENLISQIPVCEMLILSFKLRKKELAINIL